MKKETKEELENAIEYIITVSGNDDARKTARNIMATIGEYEKGELKEDKAFAEWIYKNDYVFQEKYISITDFSESYVDLNKWILRCDSFQIGNVGFDCISYTIDELYELFLKDRPL
jgi:hypothetical protein